MKIRLISLREHKLSAAFASCALLLGLISFFAPLALAQQIMVTISTGAPGDPFAGPQYVAFDSQGNLFVSQQHYGHLDVLRIDKVTGAVARVAGNATGYYDGHYGDGGLATDAQLLCPAGLAFAAHDSAGIAKGSLLIADSCEYRIAIVAPGSDGLVTGNDSGEIISTYVGESNGAGNPFALDSNLGNAFAIALDQSNNLFIATFSGEGSGIVRVDSSTGTVAPSYVNLFTVSSLVFDSAGDLLIGNEIGDLSGTPDVLIAKPSSPGSPLTGQEIPQPVLGPTGATGFPLTAELSAPHGLAFDSAGNLYVSDFQVQVIYKVTPGPDGLGATGEGSVNLYAGTPDTQGYDDNRPPLAATMNYPQGIVVNGAGNLLIVDVGNNVIRGVINGAPTDGTQTVNPPDQNGNPSPVNVTFNGGVTQAGVTTVVIGQTAPALPAGFELAGTPPVYYDVVTTAQYTAPLTVCINLNPVPPGATLQHYNSATQAWEDKTIQPVPPAGPICAQVDSLSPFAILTPIKQNQSPAITSPNAATFQTGAAGSFTVTTTGNPTPAITELGALPSGVGFIDSGNGTATLSGVPAAGTGGSHPITFAATNGVNPDATQNFVLTVTQAPAITSGNAAAFTVGSAGSFTVTATGYPVPSLSESGALPNGVTFNPATGLLSGTPTAGTGGPYAITFTAANGVSPNANQPFVLTVNQPPAITSGNATTFTVGASGSFAVTATGYPAPSLSESGALPSGVTFNPATGALSGTPTQSGVFSLTFTAHNGVGSDVAQSFSLTVNQGPAITSANNATFTVGTASSFAVTSTGFPTPTLTEAGALPSGISFVDNGNGTGALGGTPSVSGTFNVSFTASNGVGGGATQNFTLTVSGSGGGPIATVTPASINFGNVYLYHFASSKVTVQNTGTSTLTISKVSLRFGANTDRDDFFFLNSCGSSLAAGKSCTIYVYYFADHVGTATATLNIADNAPGGTQTVSLTGTAIKKGH